MANLPQEANPTTGSVSYVDPRRATSEPGLHQRRGRRGPRQDGACRRPKRGGRLRRHSRQGRRRRPDPAGAPYPETALEAGGAGPEHVVKWNLYLLKGVDLQVGFSAFRSSWDHPPKPPAITMAFVVGRLANPDFLVETDAVAVVPL